MINSMSGTVNDSELVNASLQGNRDAFGEIVGRYQSLICSLAYSATGNLSQSEDLAQEIFVTAWRCLANLDEPQRLRPWLCGIARNIINNSLRKSGREPSHRAESLDEIVESHSPEPQPIDCAISNEEAALLWRSLERIPEIYREPLVLFYREHQSIEAVAEKLELTEDAVKQRLSRGRKLLHEQVLSFVEGALERTNPGKMFTLAVLAALPALTMSAKAGVIGATAAKGSAAAAKAAGAGWLGVLLSPLFILLGIYSPYKIGMAEARSDHERSYLKMFFRRILAISLALSFVLVGAVYFRFSGEYRSGLSGIELFQVWFVGFVVLYLIVMFSSYMFTQPGRRKYYQGILEKEYGGVYPPAAWEYCSKTKFLGLPLVHIRIGDRFDHLRGPVKAWIAMGNFAIGGLFAFGGVAAAPICIGGSIFGVVSFGGIAAGVFSLGGISLGACAFGAIAIGWQAYGACAVGWLAAAGNFVFSHGFALGDVARGAQVNTDAARDFINSGTYFRWIKAINQHWFWMNFIWVGPLVVQWQIIARKNKNKPDEISTTGSPSQF